MEQFILELKKDDILENEIFYRYRYGDFEIWFSQCQTTGNIYSVSIANKVKQKFSYDVYSDSRENFYPTKFRASFYGFHVTTPQECSEMLSELNEVKDLLYRLYHFFETSEHARLYNEKHKGD